MSTHPNSAYVPAATVADVVGVPAVVLETKLRPAEWAVPRDMKWDGRQMRYAVASLPALADLLFAAGDPDAALRVREYVKAFRMPDEGAVFETARPVAVARVDTDAELVAPLVKAHASDREAPVYWYQREEDGA